MVLSILIGQEYSKTCGKNDDPQFTYFSGDVFIAEEEKSILTILMRPRASFWSPQLRNFLATAR